MSGDGDAGGEAKRSFWDIPDGLITGAWAEKRRVADELRHLVARCVTTDAPEDVLANVRELIEEAARALDPYPGLTFGEGRDACRDYDDLAVYADRGALVGPCNPLAPPMHLSMEGDTAVARVRFGPPYEGLPGAVHGGFVAAAFDQLFGYLQVQRNVGSVTATLTVDYRKITPLDTDLRYE
ncbi:hypothetical protein EON77_20270, partial [bacterium]